MDSGFCTCLHQFGILGEKPQPCKATKQYCANHFGKSHDVHECKVPIVYKIKSDINSAIISTPFRFFMIAPHMPTRI